MERSFGVHTAVSIFEKLFLVGLGVALTYLLLATVGMPFTVRVKRLEFGNTMFGFTTDGPHPDELQVYGPFVGEGKKDKNGKQLTLPPERRTMAFWKVWPTGAHPWNTYYYSSTGQLAALQNNDCPPPGGFC